MTIKIGVVGVGKIARDQHIPVIQQHPAFELAALASRSPLPEGPEAVGAPNTPCYGSLSDMLDRVDIDAVALCMPPQPRYELALQAIAKGKQVLLEKPPGATLAEVNHLRHLAAEAGVTLYFSWHSRHAEKVAAARSVLDSNRVRAVNIRWLEDVRRWHPKQEWIWAPGGLGVFDPGINALSILTALLPDPVCLDRATLFVPENKRSPIAADLILKNQQNISVSARFDWRQDADQIWELEFDCERAKVTLMDGGQNLMIDGREHHQAQLKTDPHTEYRGVYDHFYELIKTGRSDADSRPLSLVADAFMNGQYQTVDPFYD